MKKEKYQLTKKTYMNVEVNTEEESKCIKTINKEFDKAKKKDKTYHNHTISLEMLMEKYNFEIADDAALPNERIEYKKNSVRKAVCTLSRQQKMVITEHYDNDKSLRQISKEKGLSISTVVEHHNAAIRNLKKKLKEFQ